MAWATPDTYSVGQLLTSVSMNKVAGDLAYLHGDAGPTHLINDLYANFGLTSQMAFVNSGGFPVLYFGTGINNYFYLPSAGLIATGGRLQVTGIDVQRAYTDSTSGLGHMESSHQSNGATSYSVAFADAFSNVNVVGGSASNASGTVSAVTGSGFTVLNPGASGVFFYWIASGLE